MILRDIHNVIFSPESPAGGTPSALPDGPTPAPSGPGLVPVSRFRAREKNKPLPMNVTSGPLFSTLSPSADLQRSLANRLRENLGLNGSPLFVLTWKVSDTLAGPPICRLAASARRTKDKDSSGWATPNATPRGARMEESTLENLKRKARDPRRTKTSLQDLAGLVRPWPTLKATNNENRQTAGRSGNLGMVLGIVPWPTATATEPDQTLEKVRERKKKLSKQTGIHRGPSLHLGAAAHLFPEKTTWATPIKRDYRDGARPGGGPVNKVLGRECLLFPVLTAKRGRLNPEFCRWLMGFPAGWGKSAPTETR